MTKAQYKWTAQRILAAIWVAGLTALLVAIAYPINIGLLRLFIITTIPGLWLLGIFFVRRIKWLAWTLSSLAPLAVIFLALPGRTIDPARLNAEYLRQLERYNGTPYVWGGENRRGVDCSGLVRRALINSHCRLSLSTLNPRSLRAGLDLWWHDCSAKALRDQYRKYTAPVFSARSINSITNSLLMPGDIAVTHDGVHVLAHLGDNKWIEADPGILRVITVSVPTDNTWFTVPVHVMRWTHLKGAPNTP